MVVRFLDCQTLLEHTDAALQDDLTSQAVAAAEAVRATGSMGGGHGHEHSKVKNLNAIVFGKYEIETWYFR